MHGLYANTTPILYKGLESHRFWYLQEGPRTNLRQTQRQLSMQRKDLRENGTFWELQVTQVWLGHRL